MEVQRSRQGGPSKPFAADYLVSGWASDFDRRPPAGEATRGVLDEVEYRIRSRFKTARMPIEAFAQHLGAWRIFGPEPCRELEATAVARGFEKKYLAIGTQLKAAGVEAPPLPVYLADNRTTVVINAANFEAYGQACETPEFLEHKRALVAAEARGRRAKTKKARRKKTK